MRQKTVCLQVDEKLYGQWNALCSKSGITGQEGIRRIIAGHLSKPQHMDPPQPSLPLQLREVERKSHLVRIYLSSPDFAALQKAAHDYGASTAKFARRALRSALYKIRLLGTRDADAVATSIYALQNMANNLNQIARSLNLIRLTGSNGKPIILAPDNLRDLARFCLEHSQLIKNFLYHEQA